MANTRNMSRDERKAKKRSARAANKALYGGLTPKERSDYQRSEKSLKAFLAEKGKA